MIIKYPNSTSIVNLYMYYSQLLRSREFIYNFLNRRVHPKLSILRLISLRLKQMNTSICGHRLTHATRLMCSFLWFLLMILDWLCTVFGRVPFMLLSDRSGDRSNFTACFIDWTTCHYKFQLQRVFITSSYRWVHL